MMGLPQVSSDDRNRAARGRGRSSTLLPVVAGAVLAMAVLLLGGTAASGQTLGTSPLQVSTLRVNTFDNPIGIGDATPILGWRLSGATGRGPQTQQSAYEIRAASTAAQLGSPDLWDSGKVASSDTSNVMYAGAALSSRQAVAWDVRVWDGNGDVSDWSAPATWAEGLLSNSDWSAKWIEDPDYTYATNGVPNPLPIFGKAFYLGGPITKARLSMTGLGQYAANLNGQPVSDAVLEPGETSFYAEINYRTYDVTSLLQGGSNVLGIETGSGEYDRVPGRAATSSRTTRSRSTAPRR